MSLFIKLRKRIMKRLISKSLRYRNKNKLKMKQLNFIKQVNTDDRTLN